VTKLHFNYKDIFRALRLGFSAKKIWMMFLGLFFGVAGYSGITYLAHLVAGSDLLTIWAEYRLLLRADNADRRLLKYGHTWGLVSSGKIAALEEKEKRIAEIIAILEKTRKDGISLAQHLRRPENDLASVCGMSDALRGVEIPGGVAEQVEIEVKYAGYIRRQHAQVEKYRRLEGRLIPGWVDYSKIKSMRREAKEKLAKVRPRSIGQAARISGVSPADVSVLMVHLAGRPVHAARGGKD